MRGKKTGRSLFFTFFLFTKFIFLHLSNGQSTNSLVSKQEEFKTGRKEVRKLDIFLSRGLVVCFEIVG